MNVYGALSSVKTVLARNVTEEFNRPTGDNIVVEFDNLWVYLTPQQAEKILHGLSEALCLHRETDPAAV